MIRVQYRSAPVTPSGIAEKLCNPLRIRIKIFDGVVPCDSPPSKPLLRFPAGAKPQQPPNLANTELSPPIPLNGQSLKCNTIKVAPKRCFQRFGRFARYVNDHRSHIPYSRAPSRA